MSIERSFNRNDCWHVLDICILMHNWKIINWNMWLHNVLPSRCYEAKVGIIWSFITCSVIWVVLFVRMCAIWFTSACSVLWSWSCLAKLFCSRAEHHLWLISSVLSPVCSHCSVICTVPYICCQASGYVNPGYPSVCVIIIEVLYSSLMLPIHPVSVL
jgi:hypothetical protein